jgi:hypothetical protein
MKERVLERPVCSSLRGTDILRSTPNIIPNTKTHIIFYCTTLLLAASLQLSAGEPSVPKQGSAEFEHMKMPDHTNTLKRVK